MASFNAALHTITRSGMNALSDWTVGQNAGPSSTTLRCLAARSPDFLPIAALGAALGAALYHQRRDRPA